MGQGKRVQVQPGDKLVATLTYRAEDRTYDMFMTSAKLGVSLSYKYKLNRVQKGTESWAVIVLEHQTACDELPANGQMKFTDISLEVDGKLVESPVWVPKQENPACGAKTEGVDSKTVKISWDTAMVRPDVSV